MNRLCIYVTYNKENKIYEYVGRSLKSLKECCSELYLVCNYKKAANVPEDIALCADNIFYRENKGYDSGAYKDMLCDFIGWKKIYQYDELILVNDSFFGFFYPLQDTFRLMDQTDCDYWGMTGQAAGEFINPTYKFDAHIHSYFLVFKRNVLCSESFRNFWEDFVYPENFREAIVNFEIGINRFLRQQGFQGKSYIDIYSLCLKRNENPCYSMIYELAKDYRFPIMKKKCVLIRNAGFQSTLRTLAYLEKENRYPIEWVLSYLENQFHIPGVGETPCNSLEFFYKAHSAVYIYGTGVCGKNLSLYFDYKGWHHQGFIVTDVSDTDIPSAMPIWQAEITRDTGIIISVLNPDVAREIETHIGSRCHRDQLFFISECRAIRLPD